MSQSFEALRSQYEDFCLIGWGAFTNVWRARHRLTGVPVAVKVLEKAEENFLSIKGEVDILKMTMHPNIVTMFQVVETESTIFLVMELCENQLLEHVLSMGCLQEDEARKIFRQVLLAVSYCHKRGIAHRDLKPDNVMLDGRGMVKVIDFGLAVRFVPGQLFSKTCGAYAYMSPEVVCEQEYDASKNDVWSLGVLLYYMVTGTLPFKYEAHWQLKRKIIRGDYRVPQHLSEDLRNLIGLLLTANPELRPIAMGIWDHPWLQPGEGGRGHSDPLPRQVDTGILSAMKLMSFDVDNTLESVRQRKFDQLMATYCLFQYQARSRMGAKGQNSPVLPGRTPFPTLTYPDAFPPTPKGKNNVAALRTISSCAKLQERRGHGQQAEPKAGRSASLPSIHLSPQMQGPKRLCPVTAPGTPVAHGKGSRPGLRKSTVSPAVAEEKPSPWTWGSHGQGSRLELWDQMATPESSCTGEEPAPSQGLHRRRWRALRGRIPRCLRRFCLCLWPFRSSRVVPMKAGDSCED